jgi:hypothetical protein
VFWLYPDQWAGPGTAAFAALRAAALLGPPVLIPQNQVLVLPSAHFAIEGEYRSISLDPDNKDAGIPVTLVPQKTGEANGAVILGIHNAAAGGNDRGASAVDFQNDRSAGAQVASGMRSFIAGGSKNTASGALAFAHGKLSIASGEAAHAEGLCDEISTKEAFGEGAHVQGRSEFGGIMRADGHGSHASGNANNGTIQATSEGSHATGSVELTGTINASANGAHAHSCAENERSPLSCEVFRIRAERGSIGSFKMCV